MTGMLLITAHLLDYFRNLSFLRMWDKGMDINPKEETSYTTQFQEAYLDYVKNEYNAKHLGVPVNKLVPLPSSIVYTSTTPSESYQSLLHAYDFSSDDEDYSTPNNGAELTPG
jgi:hypothetical protein